MEFQQQQRQQPYQRQKEQQQYGPSSQVSSTESANASAQQSLANTESALSLQNQAKATQLEQPAINLYTALTSGDPKAAMTAASPIIGQIQSGFNASQEQILNQTAPGAARDYALSQLNVQNNAATSGALANLTAGSFDKLANLGAGYGSFSLSQLGGALNAFGGSTNAIGQLGSQQAQGKASTLGFLGQIIGGGAEAGSAYLLSNPSGCWIAEAIYGTDDPRTHIVRTYLNGQFRESWIGEMVMRLYFRIGRRVAKLVRAHGVLRVGLKPLFDAALNRALRG